MSVNSKVLVTGANGFVGRHLCRYLDSRGYPVVSAVRAKCTPIVEGNKVLSVGDIDGSTCWTAALADVSLIVHLANRAHVMGEQGLDSLAEFRRVNVDGSINLARQAIAAGVKRFVYVSSIKVNGESTSTVPFSDDDTPNPQDAYALSKFEAECALHELFSGTACELLILRPPLIYGAGVKGNLVGLSKLVRAGIPLPFGLVKNRRSMLLVDNFCLMIEAALSKTLLNYSVYLVADRQCLSIGEIVGFFATAMNKRVLLLPVPVRLLIAFGVCVGRKAEVERLVGSLEVCSDRFYRDFSIECNVSVEEGFRRMVDAQ